MLQSDTKRFIDSPTHVDIICGRSTMSKIHPGNVAYRSIVESNRILYAKSARVDKQSITLSIVNAVRDIGGRFVDKDENGRWYDIGEQRAFDKVSQALREGQPRLRDKLQQQEDVRSKPMVNDDRTTCSSESVSESPTVVIPAKDDPYNAESIKDRMKAEVLKDLLRFSQTSALQCMHSSISSQRSILQSMQTSLLESRGYTNMIREMDLMCPDVPRSSILSSFVVTDLEMLKSFNFFEETNELLNDSVDASTGADDTKLKRNFSLLSICSNDEDFPKAEPVKRVRNFSFGDCNYFKCSDSVASEPSQHDKQHDKQNACSFTDDTLFGLISSQHEPLVRQESNRNRARRLSSVMLEYADHLTSAEWDRLEDE